MRRPLVSYLLLTVSVVGLSCGLASAAEMHSYRSPGEFDRAAYDAEQERLLAWLVAEQVEAGLAAPAEITLSELEVREILMGRCESCTAAPEGLIAGMVKPVEIVFDRYAPSHGAIASTVDGGFVWTASVQSRDAAGIRVHFSDVDLPTNAELWLYSMNGTARGPYVGRGPDGSGAFWSHTVAGSTAIVQLRTYGPMTSALAVSTPEVATFTIDEVGHIGYADDVKSFCSFNADCIENAACTSHAAVAGAELAVAHMRYVKRPYIYMCSGGLLNNSISPGAPYFLTANHCISREREADTLETYFQFTTTCSNFDCNLYAGPSTLGSAVIATNSTSDFTLLLLDEAPPVGSVYLGWTDVPVVNTDQMLYRISHPSGAPQAFSSHLEWNPDENNVPICSSWSRGPWIYSQDQVGATEGGSSGSPVVNGSGRVVGQLSGGCGFNVYDNCDSEQNSTVDGAFAAYYTQVQPWLGSGAACTDADGDDYCAEVDDCNDDDASVNPGAAEICDDGIDNNCNDEIDEGCVSCTDNDSDGYCAEIDDCNDNDADVNPGAEEICEDGIDNNCDGIDESCVGCGEIGDPCTSGADCCSGRCHPRKLTCK